MAIFRRKRKNINEEPKEYWFIYGNQVLKNECDGVIEDGFKEIGNYFSSREEAEKAVEKLKAFKRLEDRGFSFHGYDDGYDHNFNSGHIEFYVENSGDVLEDLDLLFSQEDGLMKVVTVCPNCHTPIGKGDLSCRQCGKVKLLVRQISGGEE